MKSGFWFGKMYFEAIAHRYVAGSEIDEEPGNEERMDFAMVLRRVVR
jgi:hypothetical protein